MSVHDRSKASNEYVIFSVDKGVEPLQDTISRDMMYHILDSNGVRYKKLVGSWEDVKEQSFMVSKEVWESLDLSDIVLQWFQQDAVLHIGYPEGHSGHRPATLEYSDGRQEEIGWFHGVSKRYAEGLQGWTYDPALNAYFAVTDNRESLVGQFK